MNMANEGLEAKKKDEEVAQRKRKAEEDKTWEGTLLFIHTLPLPLFIPLSSFIQKHANNVSIAGAAFPIPPRRRKRLKPLSLDNTFIIFHFVLTSLPG